MAQFKTYAEAFEHVQGCGNENDIFDTAWDAAFVIAYDKAKKEYDLESQESYSQGYDEGYREGYQRAKSGLSSEY